MSSQAHSAKMWEDVPACWEDEADEAGQVMLDGGPANFRAAELEEGVLPIVAQTWVASSPTVWTDGPSSGEDSLAYSFEDLSVEEAVPEVHAVNNQPESTFAEEAVKGQAQILPVPDVEEPYVGSPEEILHALSGVVSDSTAEVQPHPAEDKSASELQGGGVESSCSMRAFNADGNSWVCAICHRSIRLAETAQVKGCQHPYCANCILQWCSYKEYPWCPQCRQPFDSLLLFKMLDGSLSDVLVEESVCLLMRAPWYTPVEFPEESNEVDEDAVIEDDDYDEEYYRSELRIGNRRWGQNGYVRGGRKQARVPSGQGAGSSSSSAGVLRRNMSARGSASASKASSESTEHMGRRAKRAQKREEVDRCKEMDVGASGSRVDGRRGRHRQKVTEETA